MAAPNISVIGLGNMGSALARSLLKAEKQIRVWNRSSERAAALKTEGAVVAASVDEAIEGCAVVVVCLSNYVAWEELTRDEAVRSALAGVTVIQLTSGAFPEVEAHAALMSTCGAKVIEGAILCFPEQIGTDDASIVVGGPEALVRSNSAILKIMSPNIRYLGDNYTAPIVLGRAAISSALGFLIGTVNGAAMCEAAGVPLSAFRDQIAENAELMRSEPLRLVEAIEAGETAETQASLAVWGEGQVALLEVCRSLGVTTQFHDGIRAMFDKSLEQDLGRHDLSAMVQAFLPDRE